MAPKDTRHKIYYNFFPNIKRSGLISVIASCCLLLLLLLQLQQCCLAQRLASFTYLGCYIDRGNNRDLDGLKGIQALGNYAADPGNAFVRSGEMRLQLCSGICSLGGFAYFSVQNGGECYCGTSFGKHGKANESDCSEACRGNASQTCGENARNSVYQQEYNLAKCRRFRESPRALLITSSSYTRPTHWSATAASVIDCTFRCNASCQAFIYSQHGSVCHLLRFALVPQALNGTEGIFVTRV